MMTDSIPLLIISLLASKKVEERKSLGQTISDRLLMLNDDSDQILKSNFVALIAKCIEDPTTECRYVFYQIGGYFNDKILRAQSGSIAA